VNSPPLIRRVRFASPGRGGEVNSPPLIWRVRFASAGRVNRAPLAAVVRCSGTGCLLLWPRLPASPAVAV